MTKRRRNARKGAQLTRVDRGPNLSEWTLDALETMKDSFQKLAVKAAEEALAIALDSPETSITFPAIWSDKEGRGNGRINSEKNTVDPLTVYLELGGLGDNANDLGATLAHSFNLRTALAEDVKECLETGAFSGGLRRISLALKILAYEIDEATDGWPAEE